MGHFRSSVWDPVLIVSQIITMQCIYYVSLGFWLFIISCILGTHTSLSHVFKYENILFKQLAGKLIMGAFVLNTLCCSCGLWRVVKKTKQCLDFSLTAHLIHLVICWCYNGYFPNTLSWWLLNTICIVLMTVTGEFLCLKSELKAIPLMGQRADL